MRKMLMPIAALAVVALCASCSSLAPKVDPPRLTIVSVGMVSADMFAQQFRVRLHVQNPNDRDLPVNGIEYQLFLEGDSFAEGTAARPFVIPAMGETEFEMTVNTNFMSSIGRLLSRLNGRDRIQYVFEGKVQTKLGLVRSLPFQETGTVEFKAMR
jgi:LEA14-like dessication related protein